MKNRILIFILIILSLQAQAQLVGTDVFLPGSRLQTGQGLNGSFGSTLSAPAGYSTNPPPLLSMVWDYDNNGFGTGTPPFYGDYTLQGAPFEGWSIEINGTRSDAFHPAGGGLAYDNSTGGSLNGANCGFTNVAGTVYGVWQGSAGPGGALSITQTSAIKSGANYVVVTVILKNTGATSLKNIYYERTCDPDNDFPQSGSYNTDNTIVYQNDGAHRVMVDAKGSSNNAVYLALGTKDARAVSCIYYPWPAPNTPANTLQNMYAQTPGLGTYFYTGAQLNRDYAIGLIYNIGTLNPGESTCITYTYIYDNMWSLDDAAGSSVTATGTISGPSSLCAGQTGSYTYSICNPGGTWSSSNTSIANIDPVTGTLISTGPLAGLVTITYTLSTPCGAASSTYLLNVYSTTPPTISGTLTVCQGYGTDLTATIGGGTWGSFSLNATVDASGHVTGVTVGTATITYTISSPPCPPVMASVVVTIRPTPVISPNYSPCLSSGDPFVLHANAAPAPGMPYTYSWTGPASFTSAASDPPHAGIFTPTACAAYAYHFNVTVTNTYGCSASADDIVSVYPQPVAGSISADNMHPCSRDIITLTVFGNNCTGTWMIVSSPPGSSYFIGPTSSSTELYCENTTTSIAYITIAYIVVNSCGVADTAFITIPIKPLPTAIATLLPPFCTPLCPNQTVSIKVCATSGSTINYNWIDPSGVVSPGSYTFPGMTPPGTMECTILNFTSAVEGLAVFNLLNVISVDGCIDNINKSIPVIFAYPHCDMSIVDPSGSPGLPDMYIPCDGDPYYVRIYGYPGVYHIGGTFLPPGFTATIPSGATYVDIGPYVASATALCAYWITQIDGCCTRVMIKDQDLCDIAVRVRDLPIISLAGLGNVCAGDSFLLAATSSMYVWPGIGHLSWAGTGVALPLYEAPVLPPPTFPPSTFVSVTHAVGSPGLPGTYFYSVTAIDYPYIASTTYTLPGCSATATTAITVNPKPGPVLFGPINVCLGGTVTYYDPSLPALSGIWSSSDPTCFPINPYTGVATALCMGSYTITYTLPTGCYATKKISVVQPVTGTSKRTICAAGLTVSLPAPAPGGTWSSSDPAIATVDGTGLVTGITAGTVTITFDFGGGCYFLTTVTVQDVYACVAVGPSDTNPAASVFRVYGMPSGAVVNFSTLVSCPGIPSPFSGVLGGPGILGEGAAYDPVLGAYYFDVPWGVVVPGSPPTICYPVGLYLSSITAPNPDDGSFCKVGAKCGTWGRPAGHNSNDVANAQNDNALLTVIPNPNNGVFTLSGSIPGLVNSKEAKIEVADMLGKVMLTDVALIENGSINKKFRIGDNVANGVYFIKIKADGINQVIRFTLDR